MRVRDPGVLMLFRVSLKATRHRELCTVDMYTSFKHTDKVCGFGARFMVYNKILFYVSFGICLELDRWLEFTFLFVTSFS